MQGSLYSRKVIMYYVYKIVNSESGKIYIGITKDIARRWRAHKSRAKNNKSNSHLYNAMCRHGVDKFSIHEIKCFESLDECCQFEIKEIAFNKLNNIPNYNMHDGGTIGYDMSKDSRFEVWKQKLSLARAGRKPSLGMKHTEENKQLFKEVSREYWDNQDTYNYAEIVKLSFKEANKIYGISKTHYYRIKKRLATNDS